MPFNTGPTNQIQMQMTEGLANCPTYEEVIYGFNKGDGTKTPNAPTLLRANSDGSMIFLSWDKHYTLTNFKYYEIQVSENGTDWYDLVFDGSDWGGTLDAKTIEYGQNILHTQIPYKEDDSGRTLSYRVRTVTYEDVVSDWSNILSATTGYEEYFYHIYYGGGGVAVVHSITPVEYEEWTNDYEYAPSGGVTTSGEADVLYEYNTIYVGSGSIATLGSADIFIDYFYSSVGTITTSNSAETQIGLEYIGDGSITTSGFADIKEFNNYEYISDGSIIMGGEAIINYSDPTLTIIEIDTTNESNLDFSFHAYGEGSSSTYEDDYIVDWGDGTVEEGTFEIGDLGDYFDKTLQHTYSEDNIYQIKIKINTIDDIVEGIHFGRWYGHPAWREQNKLKVEKIIQWGIFEWKSMSAMFQGCSNINDIDSTSPNMSTNVSMGGMFKDAAVGDSNLSGWDTSSVTSMSSMFQDATLPDGFDVSGWNTSSVTNMSSMFHGVTLPDGFDISGWDTSSVTTMYGMFQDVTLPTGFDISGWTTSSVTDMNGMFRRATLPDGFDISGWTTSSVTDMYSMFYQATLPDGFDISGWDVSNVSNGTDMRFMFYNATLPTTFDLRDWDISFNGRPILFGDFSGPDQYEPFWPVLGDGGITISGEADTEQL